MITKIGAIITGLWLAGSYLIAQVLEPEALTKPGFWVQQGATILTLWIVLYYFWKLYGDQKKTYEDRINKNLENYNQDKEHYRSVIREWEKRYIEMSDKFNGNNNAGPA